MSATSPDQATLRASALVHATPGKVRLTNLTKTSFPEVVSRFFRLFTPIRWERMRLPTSLPEFSTMKHTATLSDSPLIAAHRLGGHWTDHNLAAICHVAACNQRCPYCYVDFRFLDGQHSFAAEAAEVVDDFVRIRQAMSTSGRRLTILRISGGEPLLAPELLAGVIQEFNRRELHNTSVLKLESNITVLRHTYRATDHETRSVIKSNANLVTIHATLHALPGSRGWNQVLVGLETALEIGFDLFPAISGAHMTERHMDLMYDDLARIAEELPFRLAVRPFNLTYDTLLNRNGLADFKTPAETSPSRLWENTLRGKTGRTYLAKPRHQVALQ